jgi:phage baseplate assembly protein V
MRTPEDAPTDPDRLIRLGTIASADQAAGKCTVRLDDGATSPPIRWLERRSGATRTRSVPTVGEQVLLLCPAGELSGAIALTGLWSTATPLPGADLLELTEYADGAVISYDPVAHALVATLPAGATAAITAPGGLTINGPLTVNGATTLNGDATATGTITGQADVVGAGISLSGHVHKAVQPGSGLSGGPQ